MRHILAGAALLFLAAPAGAATPAQLASAKAYVDGLYPAISGRFDETTVRYAPELAGLIARDAAWSKASGDVGVIDGIVFCDCQDTAANYRVLGSTVVPHGADGASVAVSLRNDGVKRFIVDLVLIDGQWRVSDVHSPDAPGFLAMVRREVPKEEAELRRTRAHH